MYLKLLPTLVLSLMLTTAALGQGAHYTYPFSLSCPEGLVTSGETVSVGAVFERGHTGQRYDPTYLWFVSHGVIVSGQGTKEIRLQVDAAAGDLVNVTMRRNFLQAHYPEVQRDATCQITLTARPAARLTDEFRTRGNNCEEGLARLDAFLAELNNDPGAQGLIAVYGDTAAKGAARIRELQLKRYLRFRGFDLTRISFVVGVPRESGTTQFWLVPPGAEPPVVKTAPFVAVPRPKLPYMHSARYSDGLPECNSYDYNLQDFARELNIEPKARARVVISETSRVAFNRELKEITDALTENDVSRSRIVAIYKHVRPNRLNEGIELWVIPAGRGSR